MSASSAQRDTPRAVAKISVVTVCFNAAATLPATLASILSQTGVEVEAIVIDGASTDGTIEAAAPYRERLAVFESAPDRGIYDAMNKGLARATGDMVAFLNADDVYVAPDVLSAVAALANASGATVVAGAVRQVDASGRPRRLIPSVGFRPELLPWGVFPPHPATFVRRSTLEAVGPFDTDLKVAADFDSFLRLSRHDVFRFAATARTLVDMRIGGVSTRGLSSFLRNSKEILAALRKTDPAASAGQVYFRGVLKLPQLLMR